MTNYTNTNSIHAQKIPIALRLSAAERLVSASGRKEAAKRLVQSASNHGIDLDLIWGVIESKQDNSDTAHVVDTVRQAVLAVLGSGRTAMMFLSNPEQSKELGSIETQCSEIKASLQCSLDGLRAFYPSRVALAQTLIETDQTWAHNVCLDAGMTSVGQLDYMRKPISRSAMLKSNIQSVNWPTGIEVRPIRSLDPKSNNSDYSNLVIALEVSYNETLDCPELCGLRSMQDVVESHMATGEFSPTRWHLIFKDSKPAGCCLLSYIPNNNSVELVYLGIAPIARGLGLGRSVLEYTINQLSIKGLTEITCAVDNRNFPAISIYESLGFHKFDARLGFIKGITSKP
ncbi:MAG: GNAT family N-acetyltransferase [Phycisphaerales bacterium]|nr:GNAT family N-acetyltransferase [Phycisphaerales bacterium]